MADDTPRTAAGREHVRMWGPGDDMAGADYAAFVADVKRIEAEAIDGRVAALVEALQRLPRATCYRTHTQRDENLGVFGAVWLADVERALLSDLTAAAAERDERLRREGAEAEASRWRRLPGSYRTEDGGTEVVIDVPESASWFEDEFPDEAALIRREGWDAALAAVRTAKLPTHEMLGYDRLRVDYLTAVLDRLASEGPPK